MLAMRTRNFLWTRCNRCVWLLLLAIALPGVAAHAAPEFEEKLLLLDINQQQLNETVMVLEDRTGELYVWSQDLSRWRLRIPAAAAAVEYRQGQYFPLRSLLAVSHAYDPQRMTLRIDVRPEAFTVTGRNSPSEVAPLPDKPSPGGFINYELFVSDAPGSSQRLGQLEMGYFNPWGVGITNLFVDHLTSNPSVVRLDTTWTRDSPRELETWRFGDAISTAGTWGRSVRFGGVQFGTNFATQPGFATFTPQSAVGQAVLPSTVDVFINNALVSRQAVPPGPFSIRNLPVVSGSGRVRLVVRDLFGREQVIDQPFYASQALLKKGLHSFSYEAGFVRENFGVHSDDYGDWLATGTYRVGLTGQLTGEVHAEAMKGQGTVGFGADYLVPKIGTLSAYVAGSQSGAGSGGLVLLGIDRLTPAWSFGARTQRTTGGFTQIGLPAQDGVASVASVTSSASLSYVMGRWGAIGVAYASQIRPDKVDARIATLSYSVGLLGGATLSVSVLANLSGDRDARINAIVSIPLAASTSMAVTAGAVRDRAGNNHADLAAVVQRNLPAGEGVGYRLQTRSDHDSEASVSLQNNVGTYTFDAARDEGVTATRLSVSGGVALLGGDAFASRRIDQSFAVVRVPGFPGVHVMADNQAAGHTDANGNALIPRLRAYDSNAVSVDQRDLPMDAEIGALTVRAVPYFRSGVDVRFPIRRAYAATLTILLADGKPLPLGATVQVVGQVASAVTGSDGGVYLVNLQKSNVLHVAWKDRSCEFVVLYATGEDPLPDLGTYTCTGVSR